MGERILLVEDDPQLGAQIVEFLGRAGFEPTWWTEGRPLPPGEVAGDVKDLPGLVQAARSVARAR